MKKIFLLILGCGLAITAFSQKKKANILPPSPQSSTSAVSKVDKKLYSDLTWRNIGPFRAGRSLAVAGHADQPLLPFC